MAKKKTQHAYENMTRAEFLEFALQLASFAAEFEVEAMKLSNQELLPVRTMPTTRKGFRYISNGLEALRRAIIDRDFQDKRVRGSIDDLHPQQSKFGEALQKQIAHLRRQLIESMTEAEPKQEPYSP